MDWQLGGVIEGFYGTPWSWESRAEVMGFCHQRGMTHYVYAPKDDPLHRDRWRDPYPEEELAQFGWLVEQATLEVGFAISPGLSIDYSDPDDFVALARKCDQVLDRGVQLICLALDDIDVRSGLGADHAELTSRLRDHLDDRAQLLMIPTEYTGSRPTEYLEALAEGVPEDVPIGWTGPTVVCDRITADDARARCEVMGGRKPLLWDNYPVNDALMADRLFLGPLRGRSAELSGLCSGYLANPMVQPRCSRLPLASAAAFLRGEDPQEAWCTEAEDSGLRVLAEACDGEHPRRLVDRVTGEDGTAADLEELRQWLEQARSCTAPGLDGEADRWVDQVHQESEAALVATELLELLEQRPSGKALARATQLGMLAAALWQSLPRSGVSVFGARRGFRPVLSQGEDGEWRFHVRSLELDQNATDALLIHALQQLERASAEL